MKSIIWRRYELAVRSTQSFSGRDDSREAVKLNQRKQKGSATLLRKSSSWNNLNSRIDVTDDTQGSVSSNDGDFQVKRFLFVRQRHI